MREFLMIAAAVVPLVVYLSWQFAEIEMQLDRVWSALAKLDLERDRAAREALYAPIRNEIAHHWRMRESND